MIITHLLWRDEVELLLYVPTQSHLTQVIVYYKVTNASQYRELLKQYYCPVAHHQIKPWQ